MTNCNSMLKAIFDSQRNSYLNTPISDFDERNKRLKTLTQAIKDNKKAITDALKLDLEKSEFESYFSEIEYVLSEIKFMQKNLPSWMRAKRVASNYLLYPSSSQILQEPRGQVLILAPWNYPFQLALTPAVAALAAGNTVILKPSELAPHTSQVIESMINKHFDSKIFKVVTGDAQIAAELLDMPFDFCFFTGSTPVGRIVMEKAAKNLVPVCLELGGKSPTLVDESANLDFSARRIIWAKFFNTGQTCVAPDFVWAHEKIYPQLLEKLQFYTEKFFGMDPEASPDFGRIINERHFLRLKKLHIAEHCLQKTPWKQDKLFIPPCIYKDIQWSDAIMQEEIFGPLLPVLKFNNWEEVQNTLLRKPKPLSLYLFSENQELNQKLFRRLSFGGGCINDCILHLSNPRLPFGGVGESGMGAYHGEHGFRLMSHQKSILIQKSCFDFEAKYPPYKWAKKMLGMT